MTIEKIYQQFLSFYETIQLDYDDLGFIPSDWESLHLKYLVFYLIKYDISSMEEFTTYHYHTSYRLYIEKLMTDSFVIC